MTRTISLSLLIFLGLIIFSCRDSINIKNSTSKSESFDEFYKKFTFDSLFQFDRVKFPIHGRYVDNYDEKRVSDSIIWTKKNWKVIHTTQGIDMAEYEITKTISDSLVNIKTKGKYSDFLFEETYQKINGKWYLINLTDLFL